MVEQEVVEVPPTQPLIPRSFDQSTRFGVAHLSLLAKTEIYVTKILVLRQRASAAQYSFLKEEPWPRYSRFSTHFRQLWIRDTSFMSPLLDPVRSDPSAMRGYYFQ